MPLKRAQKTAWDASNRKNIRIADRLDLAAQKRVLSLLRKARLEINHAIADATGFDAQTLPALRAEVERAMDNFRATYVAGYGATEDTVEAAATAAVNGPLAKLKIDISSPMLPSDLTTVMADFHADQITGIAQSAKERITTELQLGVMRGAKKDDVIKSIAKVLPSAAGAGTIGGRATRIVRTEVNRLHAMVTQLRMEQAAEQVPELKKYWLTAGDDRVRDTHIKAGEDYSPDNAIPVDEPFIVGGLEAMYPRDPSLPAGEVINCRCRSVPVVDEPPAAEGGAL